MQNAYILQSSILSLLIKELPISSGTLDVSGRISYASQDVWIFSGTIRQNILFGSFLNEKLYSSVINACALNEDFAQMPNGDETVVGERGITLSGGQKARINLARALYRQGDVYLLDDPLSAVDPRVSRHLFEKCMKEHLDGKLRILATHQLQYLPQADHVVVLNKVPIIVFGVISFNIKQNLKHKLIISNNTSHFRMERFCHKELITTLYPRV